MVRPAAMYMPSTASFGTLHSIRRPPAVLTRHETRHHMLLPPSHAFSPSWEGGFTASEFELRQELGSISIQQVETSLSPSLSLPDAPQPEPPAPKVAVVAFTALFYSGMPFEDPVPTLLKEYLPHARDMALNELEVLRHLTGVPDVADKYRAAAAPLARTPPIVELLVRCCGGTASITRCMYGHQLWLVFISIIHCMHRLSGYYQ
jgi:hypothetical protein